MAGSRGIHVQEGGRGGGSDQIHFGQTTSTNSTIHARSSVVSSAVQVTSTIDTVTLKEGVRGKLTNRGPCCRDHRPPRDGELCVSPSRSDRACTTRQHSYCKRRYYRTGDTISSSTQRGRSSSTRDSSCASVLLPT